MCTDTTVSDGLSEYFSHWIPSPKQDLASWLLPLVCYPGLAPAQVFSKFPLTLAQLFYLNCILKTHNAD